jgi:rare lipoprotein A
MKTWRLTAATAALLCFAYATSASASQHHTQAHARSHNHLARAHVAHRHLASHHFQGRRLARDTAPAEQYSQTFFGGFEGPQPYNEPRYARRAETNWFGDSSYRGSDYRYGENRYNEYRYSGTAFSGAASYYMRGRRTASGERFNPYGLTAAHRSLPFGTHVSVTDLITGRSIVVTINDRGPFVRGRVLDLSLGAARALGMTPRGVTRIKATVM